MDEQRAMMKALRENPELVRRLMGSRDARALLRAVQGDGFREAVQAAAAGDSGDLFRRLRAAASTPDGAALLARLEQSVNAELRSHGNGRNREEPNPSGRNREEPNPSGRNREEPNPGERKRGKHGGV